MQPDIKSADGAAANDGDAPKPIVCGSCQRTLPGDSRYCPHCCGDDGRRGATEAGVFLGAVIGVLAGGLLTAVWSSVVGTEQTRWRDVLATLAVCITIGVLVGIFRARKG